MRSYLNNEKCCCITRVEIRELRCEPLTAKLESSQIEQRNTNRKEEVKNSSITIGEPDGASRLSGRSHQAAIRFRIRSKHECHS